MAAGVTPRGLSSAAAVIQAPSLPSKRRQEQAHLCLSAKGNNSRIKPCRLQAANAAYTENFRLQIEVV